MSAFTKNEFRVFVGTNAECSNISDHLTMIDKAYESDDRTACIRMIEDLYAIFDQADQAA